MEQNYFEVANSPLMFILCFIVIAVVFVQSLLFIRTAWKRGIEVGIDPKVMKKAMANSATFSIVPSLPIIIMLMVLSVPLGRYFPWLRLSVVGSAQYESMAAELVAQGSGLTGGLTDPGFDLTVFTTAMWVMTIGIVWGIVFNIFLMKSLDKITKKAKASGNNFVPIFSAAMFMGMLAVLSTPRAVDTTNPVGIITFVAAAICAVLCGKIAKATKKKAIGEFSMSISMIFGMVVAMVVTPLIGS